MGWLKKYQNGGKKLQSGVVVDKEKNMAKIYQNFVPVDSFPVITGKNSLKNTPNLVTDPEVGYQPRNTPVGQYIMQPGTVYGKPGYHLINPKLANIAWLHTTYDPANRAPSYNNPNPRARDLSYGCVNCRDEDIAKIYKHFPQGDTLNVIGRQQVPVEPYVYGNPGPSGLYIGEEQNYRYGGYSNSGAPKAQYGRPVNSPSIDSLRHLAGQMMDYEAIKGSGTGTTVSNWGYHQSQLPYNQVPSNWTAPQTKQEAVNRYMQEIAGTGKLDYYPSAMEKAEAGDFLYNTGRDARAYMIDQYLKSKGQSGIPNRSSYNVDTKSPNWTPELQNSLDQQWNQHQENINKLPTNDRRILLNRGRDFYYQNINKKPDGTPSDTYNATWKPRIWESVNNYKKNGGYSTTGYKADSPDRNNPYNIIPSGRITMQNVPHPVLGIDNLGNRQMMQPGGEYQFQGDRVFEVPAMKEGGIPQRYKTMGFTHVGQKKSGDGQHKWKVLAKKGDSYKVVQGGYRGMQDFKQHHSEERKDRFWDRMGGRDSSKAKDPFSPLYWHKRFGTWEYGGWLQQYQDGGTAQAQPGYSIVDYLASQGQDYSKGHRAELAQQYGIQGYDYSAEKNLELLSKLKAATSLPQKSAGAPPVFTELMNWPETKPVPPVQVSKKQEAFNRDEARTAANKQAAFSNVRYQGEYQGQNTGRISAPVPTYTPFANTHYLGEYQGQPTGRFIPTNNEVNPHIPFENVSYLGEYQGEPTGRPVSVKAQTEPYSPFPNIFYQGEYMGQPTGRVSTPVPVHIPFAGTHYQGEYQGQVMRTPAPIEQIPDSLFTPPSEYTWSPIANNVSNRNIPLSVTTKEEDGILENAANYVNNKIKSITKKSDKFLKSANIEGPGDIIKLADNYLQRQLIKNNPNLLEPSSNISIPHDYKPAIIIGTTVPENDRKIHQSQIVDLNQVKFGVRNRGQYMPIEGEGVVTTFNPFQKASEYFSKRKDPANASYIGVDDDGNIKVGQRKDFEGKDFNITRTFENKIIDFNKEEDGKIKLVKADPKASKTMLSPSIKVLDDNGKNIEGKLSLLVPKNKITNTFGSATGGRYIIKKQSGEQYLISGSLDDLSKAFYEIKGNDPYLSIYTLDNGSYSSGLQTKDKKITQEDLKNYDLQNTSGGNFAYIKPGNYSSNQNKYKEYYTQTPNIRTEKDESYKKGHSLKNEQSAIILHHTGFTEPDMKGVNSIFMTPGKESSHVVINFDGTRYRYANPDQVTFHAGESSHKGRGNVNDFGIGIEFQGDTNKKPLTDAQINSFVEYALPLIKAKKIKLSDITTHHKIAPGRKPDITDSEYERIIKRLKKEGVNEESKYEYGGAVEMQDGGPRKDLPKNLIPATDPYQRSHYDHVTGKMYLTADQYNNPDVYNHESFHEFQDRAGRLSVPEMWEGPLRRPAMVASDELQGAYFNRQGLDANIIANRFFQKHPDFQFVSPKAMYEKYIDAEKYRQPWTVEGEAVDYENYMHNKEMKQGGMIKRADGSYSQRGLWDNIRANAGSGKKPTKEMLQQERKIRSAEKKQYGGWLDQYQGGGIATIDNPIYRGTVAGQQVSSETQYPMSKREIDEIARERKEKEQAQKIKAKIESSGQRTIYPYTKNEAKQLYDKNATALERYNKNNWQDNTREFVGQLPFPSNMLAYPAVATANLSQFPNYYFNDLGQREEGMLNTGMAPVNVAMDVAADVAALAPIAPIASPVVRGAGKTISGRIGRNITRATEDLYKLNPEVLNPIQPAVAGDFHEYADYFRKLRAEDTKLMNLLNAKKINIDEYDSQIMLYQQQIANKLGLGKKLGQGNYGAVYESSDPSKVIKLGAPYKEEWTPELIENLKSVKNHGNIAIPEKVETFEISPEFGGDAYRTKQVIVMPNLNKVGEKLNLSKRDRYALFLKQARQLRDKGIELDAYNPANFEVNYDKGIIDIYDINPQSNLGPHYMHWVKNKTKQNLLDNQFYKNGGWLNQYQGGGDYVDGVYNPAAGAIDKLAKMTPQQMFLKQMQAKQAQSTIDSSSPRRSTMGKAGAIARNPITAAQYALQGQAIPDYFEKGARNPYDNAIDIINPMTYVDAAKRTATLEHLRNMKSLQDLPGAAFNTAMDAGALIGLGSELRARPNILPVESPTAYQAAELRRPVTYGESNVLPHDPYSSVEKIKYPSTWQGPARTRKAVPLTPENAPYLTEITPLTKEQEILKSFGLDPHKTKAEEELVSLYRVQPKGFDINSNTVAEMEKAATEGRLSPAQKIILNNPHQRKRLMDRDKFWGQWFEKDPNRLKFYIDDKGPESEILHLQVPKSQAESYTIKNFEPHGPESTISNKPLEYHEKMSIHPETEFIVPKDIIEKAQKYSVSDWQKLIDQHKAWGLLPAGFTLGALKSAMSQGDNQKYGGWLREYQGGGWTPNQQASVSQMPTQGVSASSSPYYQTRTVTPLTYQQEFLKRMQENQGDPVIREAAARRATMDKAGAIARNPMTAAQYVVQGQPIPDYFEKGDRNIYENAMDVINPMNYYDAAKNTLTGKHFRDAQTVGQMAMAVPLTLLDAAEFLPGGAEEKAIAKAIKKEKSGLKQVVTDLKFTKDNNSLSPADLEFMINDKLKQGLGIKKVSHGVSVKHVKGNPFLLEGDPQHTFEIKINGRQKGAIGLSKLAPEKHNIPGVDHPAYIKVADYPYIHDFTGTGNDLKGSGISGEINKAITDVLQENKKGYLYSSALHTGEGYNRWENLVKKGKADKLIDKPLVKVPDEEDDLYSSQSVYRLKKYGGWLKKYK